jgi:hypothetical protein
MIELQSSLRCRIPIPNFINPCDGLDFLPLCLCRLLFSWAVRPPLSGGGGVIEAMESVSCSCEASFSE